MTQDVSGEVRRVTAEPLEYTPNRRINRVHRRSCRRKRRPRRRRPTLRYLVLRARRVIQHDITFLDMLLRLLAREARHLSLNKHVRLPHRKRVDVFRVVHVSQCMVDETVRRFVAADCVDHVEQARSRCEAPVVDGDLRRGLFSPF